MPEPGDSFKIKAPGPPNSPERPRRLRASATMRRMVRQTALSPSNFIFPLFVRAGEGAKTPIGSMPGQFQLRPEHLWDEARHVAALGIPAVILFGIPDRKDAAGSENYNEKGIIPSAIRRIKDAAPELVVISDLCFCEYTDHGHCGLINREGEPHFNPRLPPGYLLNDATLQLLAKTAVVHARAGADIIAPSGMMDNMVAAIRGGLDAAGFEQAAIMSYAVKYASAFYGPFRDAAESSPEFGDRSQYQMDPANAREALREVEIDVRQGADIILIKPALPCLDVIRATRQIHNLPVAAYQVSGEYAMLHAAANNGWLDLKRCALESLTAIRRAGADLILTYFAKDAAQWLQEGV